MKNNKIIFSLLAAALTFVSCEDYLDADIDFGVDEAAVFGSYAGVSGYLDYAFEYVLDHASGYGANSSMNAGSGYSNCSNLSDETAATPNTTGMCPTINPNLGVWYGTTGYFETYMANNTTQIAGRTLTGLRIVNKVIENIDSVPSLTDDQYNQIKGQAHFFRGFFFFELIKRWGGIPNWMQSFDPSAGESNYVLPRLTYEECTDMLIAELDLAADLLPAIWDTSNTLRPTRIAALSVKALAELYAASPLMQNDMSTTLQKTEYGAARAATALQYTIDALTAIDSEDPSRQIYANIETMLTNGTNLAGGTNDLDNTSLDYNWNTQVIMNRSNTSAMSWDRDETVYGLGYANVIISTKNLGPEDIFANNGCMHITNRQTTIRCNWHNMRISNASGNWGYNHMTATQNAVDWHETSRGYKVILDGSYWVTDDPYYSANANPRSTTSADYPYYIPDTMWPAMYSDRDPRLTYNIHCPGEQWGNYKNGSTDLPYFLATWNGGEERFSTATYDNETGYCVKKYQWDTSRAAAGTSSYTRYDFTGPFIRTSVLWLMYAELSNELYGPATVGSVNYKGYSALTAINQLRARCNHVDVVAKNYASKETMRDLIRNEWNVECYLENHRWHNVRRWMIAEETFEGIFPIDGVTVVALGETSDAGPYGGGTTMYTTPDDGAPFSFTRKECPLENRVFERKHYWYPFPQDEIERGYISPQNPGW
ncbi:MAG: RagB/SusD family nutrient uptake outer membrane protein [Rikenellaceae bacterium]